MPCTEISDLVQKMFILSKKYFNEYKEQEYLGLKIKNKIIAKSEISIWLGSKEKTCYPHKLFLMNYLIITNIFKFCKWEEVKQNDKQKLKSLKNK